MDTDQQLSRRYRPRSFFLLLCLIPLAGAASAPTVNQHLKAVSLLLRIENANDHSRLAQYETYHVQETDSQVASPNAHIDARLYTPTGLNNPPHLLIIHGVHHLGIHDPRIIAFARALSASGVQVLTPEMPDLTDYKVTTKTIDLIGIAAREFSRRSGTPVGILGISFSGSLSLIAAADPRNARSIAFVVSLGSHDSMQRVAHFFLTGETPRPDGTIAHVTPHEYGALVLIYSHPEEFFPAIDVAKARIALRYLLWEDVAASKQAAKRLSAPSRAVMEHLYLHDRSTLIPQLQRMINDHTAELQQVSAEKQLARLKIPVLLLHGAADDVIPNTELLWLERDVPPEYLQSALITPLLSHLDVAGDPSATDKVRLVQFMSTVLELAENTRSQAVT
jgi:pimeloyl-ACP methyl ester carboxylesterase